MINIKQVSALIALFFGIFGNLFFTGCEKYRDANAPFYKYLAPNLEDKPYYLERRRVNLDSNSVLETLLIYKLKKESEWRMIVLKKKGGTKINEKIIEEKLSDAEDLLDRLIVRDFFREGFNSLSLEFRTFDKGKEKGLKKFLVYRIPSMLEKNAEAAGKEPRELFSRLVPYQVKETATSKSPALEDASKNKELGKKEEDSPIFWEDTNEDGQLEIVSKSPEKKDSKKGHENEYAYSRLNKYKNSRIYKYNGLEFLPFQVDQPFLYYKKITLPQNLKMGESAEVVFKMTNLGTYTPKTYLTFSFPQKVKHKMLSLKNVGRNYETGSRIFHLKTRGYIAAKYPLIEYSIFPWPNKRVYTFKIQVLAQKDMKDEKLLLLHRASLEARGRSIFTPPSGDNEGLGKNGYLSEIDQQGFPAYLFKIKIIP